MLFNRNEARMDPMTDRFDEAATHIVITSPGTILLASPEKPDPDSVSCLLAFRAYLSWKANCIGGRFKCRLYAPDKLGENSLYELMKPAGNPAKLITANLPRSSVNLCVLFDYGDAARTHTASLEAQGTFFIGFDHHPKTNDFPKNGIEIIDEYAPSTTALLYRFFKHEGFPINADVATCLFVGLAADTQQFSNSLTNAEAHATAEELIRLGARHHEIAAAMRPQMTLARFRAHRRLMPLIHIDEENGFCFFSFSRNDCARHNATEKDFLSFRKMLDSVKEITTTVVYYELSDGGWYGSIRTKPNAFVFAKAIAAQFGGGGHEHAAGFTSRKTPKEISREIAILIQKAR